MKKIYSFLVAALLVLGFAACEDVENPFPQPGSSTENPGGGEDVPTGPNLLTNGDFEKWTDGKADLWNGVTGNGTVAQSTDAHAGSYSVALNGASTNKRMAYRPLRLKAGTYALSAYGKAATEEGGAFKLGYAILTAGSVADTQNDYIYSSSPVNVTNTTWATDTYVFTLDTDTVVNLLVMNYKNPGKQILIDDVALSTSNGAILSTDPYGNGSGTEPETPETPETSIGTFVKTTSISNGSYLIAALSDGVYKLANSLGSSKTYGWLSVKDATYADQITTATADEVFTIKAVEGGYTIQDSQNRYLYMKGNYDSFNVDATMPAEGAVWTITANADGTMNIINVLKQKTIQYSVGYTSYGAYSEVKNVLPSLFIKK